MADRQRRPGATEDRRKFIIEFAKTLPYPRHMFAPPGAILCWYTNAFQPPATIACGCAECHQDIDGAQAVIVGDNEGATHAVMVCGDTCAAKVAAALAAYLATDGLGLTGVALYVDDAPDVAPGQGMD